MVRTSSSVIKRFSSSSWSRTAAAAAIVASVGLLRAAPARAGHGSGPAEVASAIASGSPDAIKSELERAEYLVCAACVDYVLPLIDNGDDSIREVAAWWLARRGVRGQVFTDMLARLGQPDSVKARNAADVLGAFAFPQAVPALGAALSNPIFDAPARSAMARALGSLHSPDAAAPLEAVLGDPQADVRAAALGALRRVPAFHDGAVALPLLSDAEPTVRVQAIYTVAELQTTAAAPELVALLQGDPSPSVRKRAAWALGHIGASASVAGPALAQAASADSSPLVRSLARAAIAGLKP